MLFNLVFKGTGIQIYHATAVNELYHPLQWWAKEKDARAVLIEYASMVHNLFYHFVFKKGRTSFDAY